MPQYTLLPTTGSKADTKRVTTFNVSSKAFIFRFLAAFTAMFVIYRGLSAFSREAGAFLRTGIRPCHQKMAGTGTTRNVSISSVGKIPSHYTLPSGDKIPSVALGVWKAKKGEVGPAVRHALKIGYRHIDGAFVYGNEEEVGQAIRESGINRSELFLTSKLWNTFHAPEDVEPALDDSLSLLGTDYLDLYLIHWPIAFKKGTRELNMTLTEDVYPTWKKMEEMVDKGKVKNIGISNFNIARIRNLTANPLKYKPAVNQVELSYWNPQPELVHWAREHGMLLEAYSPLGGDGQVSKSLKVPEVQEIAQELGIKPAQVIISWLAQRGTIVLPKSVTPSRIEENMHVYTLPEKLFDKMENAARSHPPMRTVNASKGSGLPYDVFDENWPFDK